MGVLGVESGRGFLLFSHFSFFPLVLFTFSDPKTSAEMSKNEQFKCQRNTQWTMGVFRTTSKSARDTMGNSRMYVSLGNV